MDANIDLNTSGKLPDGTAASQRESAPVGVSPEDLRRGYTLHPVERTSIFDPETTGENQVGDPFTYGGFCGRPQGTAR